MTHAVLLEHGNPGTTVWYELNVHPINGDGLWEDSQITLLPPTLYRQFVKDIQWDLEPPKFISLAKRPLSTKEIFQETGRMSYA